MTEAASIENHVLEFRKGPAIEVHGTTPSGATPFALPVGVGPSGASPPGGRRTIMDLAEATFGELIAIAWGSKFGGGGTKNEQKKPSVPSAALLPDEPSIKREVLKIESGGGRRSQWCKRYGSLGPTPEA
jgi:hypothetical protein